MSPLLGARVDSEAPVYEYSFPELWADWTWSEKYPGRDELRRYFDHVDKTFDIKKDVEFGARVVGAQFDTGSNKWNIATQDGRVTHSKFFVLAVGFSAKRYIPDFKGLESFKGIIHHSSAWPENGIDVKGKRAAVIGTGATGVQIIQEWAKEAENLTVFQKTPNLALPMRQGALRNEAQHKSTYEAFFQNRLTTFAGMRYTWIGRNASEDTEAQREAAYEEMWNNGGFELWLAGYKDTLLDLQSNRYVYDFWAKKTRARILDPQKRDILAPLEPIHPLGTKRPSLEQDYYDLFNQPNVDLVDVRNNVIAEIKPDGILLEDGSFHEVDVIALATGFDALTGGITNMGLRDMDGKPLAEEWKDDPKSYLGMTLSGYPNGFFLYGVHGPTAFSNGPTTIEIQGNWIVEAVKKIQESGLNYIYPTTEAQKSWKDKVLGISDHTLFPLADSWYMGANIPGKKREQLNYAGGVPEYEQECRRTLKDWEGFVKA